jgi:preprotein translocase subunit YajC
MLQLIALLAEGEGGQSPQGGGLGFLLPMLLIFFAFYIFVLRPMKNQERDRAAKMMSTLKKGDKVITTAGIYGTVVSVAEKEDEVVVKVDDNTRLKMMKASIMRNVTQEEAAAAAKATPAPASDAIVSKSTAVTAEKK